MRVSPDDGTIATLDAARAAHDARRRETGSTGHGVQPEAGHPTAEGAPSPSPGAALITGETTLAELEAVFRCREVDGLQLLAFGRLRDPHRWEAVLGDRYDDYGASPTPHGAINDALQKWRGE